MRVSATQKADLRRLARRAGQDLSTYVLARSLSAGADRVARALRALRSAADESFAYAELSDALNTLDPRDLDCAIVRADLAQLPDLAANYVAAMFEQACAARGVATPEWTGDVVPLDEPWFATQLQSLRLHLLRASPVPFKRRNLFIDPGAGRV